MSTRMTARMTELVSQRVPFVHVTVVRAQKPTSVHPGDDAIVLADGSIEGFVGGVCAEGSVRTAALDALEAGETLLLRVLPDSDEEFPATPGARVVTNPCLSGGALEMFLEPQFPAPLLGVVGDTPIAQAVRAMAGPLGFEVGDVNSDSGFEGATAVIVSSHGRGEPEPIRAALQSGVGFIGVVASHRRGSALLSELQLTDDERARIRTPVGLKIGASTPAEIALSIMAEVVQAIRVEGLTAADRKSVAGAAAASEVPALTTALDPICGMTVVVGPDTAHLEWDGVDHWFCCIGCRDTFAAGER
jgi:xanthine dehydrogenase accessory factor